MFLGSEATLIERVNDLRIIMVNADSLGWDVPDFDEFHARADAMLESGYRLD